MPPALRSFVDATYQDGLLSFSSFQCPVQQVLLGPLRNFSIVSIDLLANTEEAECRKLGLGRISIPLPIFWSDETFGEDGGSCRTVVRCTNSQVYVVRPPNAGFGLKRSMSGTRIISANFLVSLKDMTLIYLNTMARNRSDPPKMWIRFWIAWLGCN